METKPHFLTEEQSVKLMRKTIREQRKTIDSARRFARAAIAGLKIDLDKAEDKEFCRGAIKAYEVMRKILILPSAEIENAISEVKKVIMEYENEGKS